MKIFYLPDLGEGLLEAEISEWHVQVGERIEADECLVSVETAKALVEIPSPVTGTIRHCYGDPGDTIKTGEPLVAFYPSNETSPEVKEEKLATVVGNLKISERVLEESPFEAQDTPINRPPRPLATPAVRALAQHLSVELSALTGSGPQGAITLQDVTQATKEVKAPTKVINSKEPGKIQGVKRKMVEVMEASRDNVVPITLTEEADIHAWSSTEDSTVRLIQGITAALAVEPGLNAYFYGHTMQHIYQTTINVGLAMDTAHGLFVPVIKDVGNKTPVELRGTIERFKKELEERTISHEELSGATILLSNFGSIYGKFGDPTLIPPMVAIVGIGRRRHSVVPYEGEIVVHPILPVSITVDHRVITGGELCRFLKAFITDLER